MSQKCKEYCLVIEWQYDMCNSQGTLQQMMNEIFIDMLIAFLVIFMDNLLIATRKIPHTEHMQKAQQVLQRLQENGLCLKPLKCIFAQLEVEILGM